jgi:hypothetical protein
MKKIFRSIVDVMTKTVSISVLGLVLYSPESISAQNQRTFRDTLKLFMKDFDHSYHGTKHTKSIANQLYAPRAIEDPILK